MASVCDATNSLASRLLLSSCSNSSSTNQDTTHEHEADASGVLMTTPSSSPDSLWTTMVSSRMENPVGTTWSTKVFPGMDYLVAMCFRCLVANPYAGRCQEFLDETNLSSLIESNLAIQASSDLIRVL